MKLSVRDFKESTVDVINDLFSRELVRINLDCDIPEKIKDLIRNRLLRALGEWVEISRWKIIEEIPENKEEANGQNNQTD
jgi:hypothetical protein